MWRVFLLLLVTPFTQLLCAGMGCRGCRLIACTWLPCTVILFTASTLLGGQRGLARAAGWLLAGSALFAATASVACLASSLWSTPRYAVFASEAALALYYTAVALLELHTARSSEVRHVAAFALATLALSMLAKPPLHQLILTLSLLTGSLAAKLAGTPAR